MRRVTDKEKEFIKEIIEYVREDLGCDHSVGICSCALVYSTELLENLLQEGDWYVSKVRESNLPDYASRFTRSEPGPTSRSSRRS